MIEKQGQIAAGCIVDGRSNEGDQEMEEKADGCGPFASLKGRRAKRSTGDGLQKAFEGHTLTVKEGRSRSQIKDAREQTG